MTNVLKLLAYSIGLAAIILIFIVCALSYLGVEMSPFVKNW